MNNLGRVLANKKVLEPKETDIINNTDIYQTYNDIYLSEKESEEELFQGIQSGNGLTLFRMGLFRAAHEWWSKKNPLLKICHTYPKMRKLGTIAPYLKKI